MYTFVKTHCSVHYKLYTLLHVNNTSVKLTQNNWINCTDQREFSKGESIMTKEGTVFGRRGENERERHDYALLESWNCSHIRTE